MSAMEQCGQLFTISCLFEGVCAVGVLKQLTDQPKEMRIRPVLQHLLRYREDPAFLNWIVTNDESRCHLYEPETKQDSIHWKHASSPPPKNCKGMASAGKVLLPVFFDIPGLLLVEILEHKRTINSDIYCGTLRNLRRSIKNKRSRLLT